MAAILAATPSNRVLDIGCGTGEDAAALAAPAIGIERSVVMCNEARRTPGARPRCRRRDGAPVPRRAPRRGASRSGCPASPRCRRALREWSASCAEDGRLISFDPDLTTASVEGVDERSAAVVRDWRVTTRPGAATVHALQQTLEATGFTAVRVEPRVLDLGDLDRADGIMGLASWGRAAADAGVLSRSDAAGRWYDDVNSSARAGTLRYRCSYLLASATAG